MFRYTEQRDNDNYVIKKSSDNSFVVQRHDDCFYVKNKDLLSDSYLLEVASLAKASSDEANILVPKKLNEEDRVIFFNKMRDALISVGFSPDLIEPKNIPEKVSISDDANTRVAEPSESTRKSNLPDFELLQRSVDDFNKEGEGHQKRAAQSIIDTVKDLGDGYSFAELSQRLSEKDSGVRVSIQKDVTNSANNLSFSFMVQDGKFRKFITANELCANNTNGLFGINKECFRGCTIDPKSSEKDLLKQGIEDIKLALGGGDAEYVSYRDVYNYIKSETNMKNPRATNVFKRGVLATGYNIIPRNNAGLAGGDVEVNLYNSKANFKLSDLMKEPSLKPTMGDELKKAAEKAAESKAASGEKNTGEKNTGEKNTGEKNTGEKNTANKESKKRIVVPSRSVVDSF